MKFSFSDLGIIDYNKAYNIQRQVWESVYNTDSLGKVLLAEHHPVLTMGRSAKEDNILVDKELLLRDNIQIVKVERGGDVTYHGPGQIVLYPILNLKHLKQDIKWYVHSLEAVVIDFLSKFEVKAFSKEGHIGVWTEKGKIASIGIAIRKWIAFHGISINIDPDMRHFTYIRPCGLESKIMTSLAQHSNYNGELKPELKNSFNEILGGQL